MPIVYRGDYDFQICKAITLCEGNDVALVACGSMVKNALDAQRYLKKKESVAQ